MGYKYGIWLVYNQKLLATKHIGHFTISCFMEYLDAVNLYDELKNAYGIHSQVELIGNNPIFFPTNYYIHDNNNLYSWGYYGISNMWDKYKKITDKYKCDFSHKPHTSIEYSKNKELLNLIIRDDINLACTLHVVNINDDDPYNWNILL